MHYFGRQIIRKNWSAINKVPLTLAGLEVRRQALRLIKRVSDPHRYSPPGSAPYSHQPGKSPPFRQIYSDPNFTMATVTIGMVGYDASASHPVPGRHEHGADISVMMPRTRTRTTASGRTRRHVTMVRVHAHYPERPFMEPGLQNAIPHLPTLWANALIP